MNNQQPGMNTNPGGGGAYIAPPKPDMEYICAGTINSQPSCDQVAYVP